MAWKLWTTEVEEVVLVENGEPGGAPPPRGQPLRR